MLVLVRKHCIVFTSHYYNNPAPFIQLYLSDIFTQPDKKKRVDVAFFVISAKKNSSWNRATDSWLALLPSLLTERVLNCVWFGHTFFSQQHQSLLCILYSYKLTENPHLDCKNVKLKKNLDNGWCLKGTIFYIHTCHFFQNVSYMQKWKYCIPGISFCIILFRFLFWFILITLLKAVLM